jgi:hypothetical protein
MKSKSTHDTWDAWESHWRDYAEAFVHSLRANDLLSRFITNSAVTGAYAETWIRFIAKSMLPQFRVSTGAIIRPTDLTRYSCNNTIVYSPKKEVDVNGVFAFIHFLSQIAGQSDLIVR